MRSNVVSLMAAAEALPFSEGEPCEVPATVQLLIEVRGDQRTAALLAEQIELEGCGWVHLHQVTRRRHCLQVLLSESLQEHPFVQALTWRRDCRLTWVALPAQASA